MLTAQVDSELKSNSVAITSLMLNDYAEIAPINPKSPGFDRFYGDLRDESGKILYTMPRKETSNNVKADIPDLDLTTLNKLRDDPSISVTVPGTSLSSSGWRVRIVTLNRSDYDLIYALPMDSVQDTVTKAAMLEIGRASCRERVL